MMREWLKTSVNALLGRFGMRVVNAQWGPRGFAASFAKLRTLGIVPRQIVDVGAASGTWTRECISVFPDSQYFLIDPLEENRAALEQLQRERSNVKYWRGALGAAEGKLVMHVHGDQSSFFDSKSEYTGSAVSREIEVRTLDSLVGSGLQPPDLIKIDTQGYELEALKGAQKCLETAEFLLLEVLFRELYDGAPLAHDVISYCGDKGYRVYDICTYVQNPSREGGLYYADLLFARGNSRVFEGARSEEARSKKWPNA